MNLNTYEYEILERLEAVIGYPMAKLKRLKQEGSKKTLTACLLKHILNHNNHFVIRSYATCGCNGSCNGAEDV